MNLILGTNGNQNHFCSDIRFAPSGSNNLKPGYVFDSMIGCSTDAGGGGALSFPAPSSGSSVVVRTYYGATGANVNGPITAQSFTGDGSGLTFASSGTYYVDKAPYNAKCDGTTDDSAAIQSAATAAGATNGTVVIPNKLCKTLTGISLPANVNITGAKTGPFDGITGRAPLPGEGPTLLVYDTTNPEILMAGNKSSVSNLMFYYPNQVKKSGATPVVFPPTIQTAGGFAGFNIVGNTFLNSYDAIALFSGRGNILHDNIGAIHYGINFVNVHDYVLADNIRLVPFWDLPGDFPLALDTWVQANGSWFNFIEADAPYLSNIQGFGGGTGITLTDDGTFASTGSGVNIMLQSVQTGIAAYSTNAGPGWQFTSLSVGNSPGGHPIVLESPHPQSCPHYCNPSIIWNGGSVWNPDNSVVNNNPGAAYQITGVAGITGTLSQVGSGQNNPTIVPVGIFSARTITGGSISNIPSCFICFGQSGTPATAFMKFGNTNSYTSVSASNAHAVNGVSDYVFGLNSTAGGAYVLAVDQNGNQGISGIMADAATPTNLKTVGGKCDGTTSDSTAYTSAPPTLRMPLTDCYLGQQMLAFKQGHITGIGRALSNEGGVKEPMPNDFMVINSFPAWNGVDTGFLSHTFNGDYTNTDTVGKVIQFGSSPCSNGMSSVLGCPVTGTNRYQFTPPADTFLSYTENDAGFSDPTTPDNARTGLHANDIYISQGDPACGNGGLHKACNISGMGDMTALNITGIANSTAPAGAATYIDEPDTFGEIIQFTARQSDAYLQGWLVHPNDNNQDVSFVGGQVTSSRDVPDTSALKNIWQHYMSDSTGAQPIDSAYSARGPTVIGLDLTGITGSSQAISMPHDTNVCFDSSFSGTQSLSRYVVTGDACQFYKNADSAIETTVGGITMTKETSTAFRAVAFANIGNSTVSATGCTYCFGNTNTTSASVFRMGNANGTGHYTGFQATNAHAVAGVTDLVFGISDTSTFLLSIDATGSIGIAGKYVAVGGVQPNNNTGGYAAEVFPQGIASTHPQIATGTCVVTSPSTTCSFQNSFAFANAAYLCTVSGMGAAPATASYTRPSTTQITIFSTSSITFSYNCVD